MPPESGPWTFKTRSAAAFTTRSLLWIVVCVQMSSIVAQAVPTQLVSLLVPVDHQCLKRSAGEREPDAAVTGG